MNVTTEPSTASWEHSVSAGYGGNHLLAQLPYAEYARLERDARVVEVEPGATLHSRGDQIDAVYFPLTALVSTIVDFASGDRAEVGLTGNDGFVGLGIVLGDGPAMTTAIVHCGGTMIAVRSGALRRHLASPGAILATVLLRYVNVLAAVLAQGTACNIVHRVEQRLARRLLMTRDRVGETFRATHDELALMLAVRRPTVTRAADALRADGAIAYERGRIRIIDEALLRRRSCECYDAVTAMLAHAHRPAAGRTPHAARLTVGRSGLSRGR